MAEIGRGTPPAKEGSVPLGQEINIYSQDGVLITLEAPCPQAMTLHDLGQLVLLLLPGMVLSVVLLFTFAAGG
jgi:hypothetical protein